MDSEDFGEKLREYHKQLYTHKFDSLVSMDQFLEGKKNLSTLTYWNKQFV